MWEKAGTKQSVKSTTGEFSTAVAMSLFSGFLRGFVSWREGTWWTLLVDCTYPSSPTPYTHRSWVKENLHLGPRNSSRYVWWGWDLWTSCRTRRVKTPSYWFFGDFISSCKLRNLGNIWRTHSPAKLLKMYKVVTFYLQGYFSFQGQFLTKEEFCFVMGL